MMDRWERDERDGWARVAGMTLGQAAMLLRDQRAGRGVGACACIGGPLCCRYPYGQANALVRVAHIAVKLIETRP
jgi:hypothetical protein